MKLYTKETLIEELKKVRDKGWIKNARPGNVGGVGNTLEDLLGIEENNLPIQCRGMGIKMSKNGYKFFDNTFSYGTISARYRICS